MLTGGRYWSRWRDECIKDLLPEQKRGPTKPQDQK